MELWHIVISIAIIIAIAFTVWYFIFRDTSNIPPLAPSNLNHNMVSNILYLSWDNVPNVDSYKVFVSTQPGKNPVTYTTNTNKISIDKISACNKYYVALQSIKGQLESPLSEETVIDTSLKTPIISYVLKRGNMLRVDIANDSVAKEYAIEVGNSINDFTIKEQGKDRNFQVDVSKLGDCSKLYVRAYTIADNCKSPYSAISTYTPEEPPKQTTIERVWKIGSDVFVQWTSVGRQGDIMYSVEAKFGDRDYVQMGSSTPHTRTEKGINLPNNIPSLIRVKAMKLNSCASISEPYTFDPKMYEESNNVKRFSMPEKRKVYQY